MTAFTNLLEALRVLSSSAPLQEQYLASIGHFRGSTGRDLDRNIDELALQLEDALYGSQSEIKLRYPSAAAAVGAVDNKLAEMTHRGDSSLWTLRAVFESRDWSEVRELAAQALEALGK